MDKPYKLLVDIGNTFVKWGRYKANLDEPAHVSCLESGHALLEEIPALAAQLRRHQAPAQIVISNVAGTRVRASMLRLLEIWPDTEIVLVANPKLRGIFGGEPKRIAAAAALSPPSSRNPVRALVPPLRFLDDGVAVALTLGEDQEDLELHGTQGEEVLWILGLRHGPSLRSGAGQCAALLAPLGARHI